MRASSHRGFAATIAAGTWKGRKLRYPVTVRVRPTMQRTKESLFSSLGERVAGCVFADLYAGAGAVGIEALSRGARRVHFVEVERDAVRALRENLTACGADPATFAVHERRVADVLADAANPLAEASVVFADPPYSVDATADLLQHLRPAALPRLGVLILEHPARHAVVPPAHLGVDRDRRFGDTMLTYLVPAAGESPTGGSA
jgi:16S rRNA (guanine(966)-N(2))-methyltransferase RsmD